MKATYSICFETTTPESVEAGDFAETGFEREHEPYERGDLRHLRDYEGFSGRHACDATDWFETGFSVTNYRTGEEENRSLHFRGVTPSTFKRINRYLNRKPVLGECAQ